MPAPTGGLPSIEQVYGDQDALSGDILGFFNKTNARRTEQYNAATEELKKRRFGPSQAEQLFALAAAIGKPTYDRSFGSIMANVTPTLGQLAQANREASEQRSAAAEALREKYLTGQEGTELATLQERRKALADKMELAKALNKPPTPHTSWSDRLGAFVTEGEPVPTGRTRVAGGATLREHRTPNGTLVWVGPGPNNTVVVYDANGKVIG